VLLAATLIAWLARWGADWPAQEFRAWSAQHFGLTAWTNLWYGGEALPGYSVLYPPLAALFGAAGTGVLAVTGASLGAAHFTPRTSRLRAIAFNASVGLILVADLLIGQIPYLLGVAFGVWSVAAVTSGRPWLGGVLAAASSLASPLAGAFVLISLPAVAAKVGIRRAGPLLAATVGMLTSVLLDGAGGRFPYHPYTIISACAFAALILAVTRTADRSLRVFAMSYGVAALALAVVPNPLGGNIARLGQLVALPLLCIVAPRLRITRRSFVVAMALGAAAWATVPSVVASARGSLDPSRSSTFYSGLLGFLHTQNPSAGRLEVVLTREHWESLWVAKAFPIARGWERQTDLGVNDVLYQSLTAPTYRTWLDDNAVSLVALPKAPIDYGGTAEARLLLHPPAYLVPVWHDANWQVWRVRGARALVDGPASLGTLGPASFVLDFRRAGMATVRIRASDMWAVTHGDACVMADRGGWLTVSARSAGPVQLRSRVGVHALGHRGDSRPRCSS
jgi:hypothetical protein